jgi:glycerol kinase
VADLSAIGAATLAGLAVGLWDGLDAVAALPRPTGEIVPAGRLARAAWDDALARCLMGA